ncbi:ExbD/TolR family protein [Arenimonas terrae]|jgi:biopolymer transport protein ExbD|uniref:Biopolymer transporter ExbD n=1 Tax=Arenimonas terrae TaxID=2546226 RepID=A0A5C4RQU7_9GAMM|nr:biopolymer transporter ExbD [Arenimonas terrae]TNJ33335.1 biopolymer transporter ExbD [Arenimonas terrae]
MAFSSNSSGGGPMADINVTPLVDVMLVLLIIFMITAPLMSHKVKVELPQATLEEKPKIDQPPITLAVTANGKIYWNDEPVSRDALDARLAILAQRTPQPQVDVRADNITKYGVIAEVVKQVRMAGIRKVGFVSTPER